MFHLWCDVRRRVPPPARCAWMEGGGDQAETWELNEARLALCLEHGHPCLHPDDEPDEVVEDMILCERVINSDPDDWPETYNMSEEEWAADKAREERLRMNRQAAARLAQG